MGIRSIVELEGTLKSNGKEVTLSFAVEHGESEDPVAIVMLEFDLSGLDSDWIWHKREAGKMPRAWQIGGQILAIPKE